MAGRMSDEALYDELRAVCEPFRRWTDAVLRCIVHREEHAILCGESSDTSECGHDLREPPSPAAFFDE